ncbi:alpha/beta hydrolase-fold protein [Prosthecobacter sp.]|uniref:alpha/beta hydrolase n=1 Tax=Prosthecobacter sp. TaxID=1965333 RepID=UPI002ABC1D3B|nr:alpha/beta hydrolase-fold protein [Prosthecobacter sp.]MDZ4404744.1 alpha/beta hydrolase-fold protein [Prosthecobacter sp.]
MTEHQIPSTILPAPRKAWIHRSTNVEAKDCLLFLDGELYTERVKAPAILEAKATGALKPVTCVYLTNASAAGRQADYTCNAAFADFLAREMPPWIEREAGRFERLFLCGLSLSALQAVFTALRHPGVFAGVLAQSPSAWWQDEWLAESLPAMPTTPNRFWLSVGGLPRKGLLLRDVALWSGAQEPVRKFVWRGKTEDRNR